MSNIKDKDGNEWQPFQNQFQQRQLRCITGDRVGDVIHDPRLGDGEGAGRSISSRDPVRPARDAWLEGLDRPVFPDLWE